MNILITGGAGFIGSNLALRLVSEGHRVTVVDDLSIGRLSNLEPLETNRNFRFQRGSILEREVMEPLVRDADLIFHLAAVVGVKHVLADPVRGIRTNVLGTELTLELAHRFDRRIVIASSSEVYGKSTRTPLREDGDRVLGPTRVPRWSYAESKSLDEFLAFGYARQGLRVSMVRYFNSYGPRTNPDGYGSVATRFVMQALKGEPLTVYGGGSQTRCFTYVADTVDGTIRAGFEPAAIGEVFNIGNDREVTIRELAELVLATIGCSRPIVGVSFEEMFGLDFEEPMRRVPDTTLARTLIGFQARVPLEEGLRMTVDWFGSAPLDH
jgi:UDP-glucose 4-epimerase